jgi:hypothetical protein
VPVFDPVDRLPQEVNALVRLVPLELVLLVEGILGFVHDNMIVMV